MDVYPTQLALAPDGRLLVKWSDSQWRAYSAAELRSKCPCATCREKRSQPPPPSTALPILSSAEARPLKLLGMKPVGNYAYGIQFSDGHDTGIFSVEFLRELGQIVEDTSPTPQ